MKDAIQLTIAYMRYNARKGSERRQRRAGGAGPRCSRRRVLAGAVALVLSPAATVVQAAAAGEPFSDGSRFADDGTGWVA
jgi:hypothetical protein